MKCYLPMLIALLSSAPLARSMQTTLVLPVSQATALDGHKVSLPQDLSSANVVIVGFSRASADATTAWEIPTRTKLANRAIGFYDVAVLASVPGFIHGWVVHAVKGKVPPVLQPRFLPIFSDEVAWKTVCGYDSKKPDAAYVLLVDRRSKVLWRTNDAYSDVKFAEMSARAKQLAESEP